MQQINQSDAAGILLQMNGDGIGYMGQLQQIESAACVSMVILGTGGEYLDSSKSAAGNSL